MMVEMKGKKGGTCLVDEADAEEFGSRGFTVVKAKDDPDPPADPISSDDGVTVKDAEHAISKMETISAVEAYVVGDERKGVIEAADGRIAELRGE